MPGLKLVAELGGDGAGFQAMMSRANRSAKDFGNSAIAPLKNMIAGAFTVGAIESLVRKTVEFGGHLRDISDRLGINVEWLQATGFAAKQAGADLDKLTAFLEKLAVARDDALAGGAGGAKKQAAFAQFGIGAADLKNSSLTGLFDQIAKAYQTGSQQKLLPAVREIGGRSAGELVATFVAGLEDGRSAARASGQILSEDAIDSLDEIGDEFTALGNRLMVEFTPAILTAAEAIAQAIALIEQSGAGWVGFLTGFLAKFNERKDGWKGFWQALADGLEDGVKQFQHDVVSAEADQLDEAAIRAKARAATKNARHARENAGGDFTDLSPAAPRRSPISTDPLVGIGNFLGRNPGLVNSVANQQLLVARQHLDISKQTLVALQNLKNVGAGNGLTLLVPGN